MRPPAADGSSLVERFARSEIARNVQDEGLDLVEFGQGFVSTGAREWRIASASAT
jgi:hypothetical protein